MLENATPNELSLKWSPVSEEGVTYIVEMSNDNGRWWKPVESGLTSPYASLPSSVASPLEPLQLRVLAENSNGTSPPSLPVLKVPVRAAIPQMAGIKPHLTQEDIGSVRITWPDPRSQTARETRTNSDHSFQPSRDMTGDITYAVQVREGSKGDWQVVARGLKDNEYVHHLKPGAATMVRVLAENRFGTSEPSGSAMANLRINALIPDLDVDPPWTSVIRPDREGKSNSAIAGLNLHWKAAYLPEFCDKCVHGLKPVYTIEWRKGRSSPWRVLDENVIDTDAYRLPNFVVKAMMEDNSTSSIFPQPVEVRVSCRNDYGSTLPTKSLKLSSFGMTKQNDDINDDREQTPMLSLPTFSHVSGNEKLPVWLTSADVDEGVSLSWEDTFRNRNSSSDSSDPHGKYRIECALINSNYSPDNEELATWKPIGPSKRPILGDSFCLDMKPHATMEQRLRLLALTNRDGISGWVTAYKHIAVPSKTQLLPSEVQGLRAQLLQNSDATFSIMLNWKELDITEGEKMLERQLTHGALFVPSEICYRLEVQDTTSGHGLWREIGNVAGRHKTSFLHTSPTAAAHLKYRITPYNKFGDGPESLAHSIVNIPRRLTELQGYVKTTCLC